MYIVLYNFQIKPELEKDFIKGWKGLTSLIYKFEGSLGSRLHKKDNENYIAYAQWPNKTVFENSGSNLPEQADHFRDMMRASCQDIKVLEKLDVTEDLLAHNVFK